MDNEKIKEGVRLILEGIGEDVNREGLLETPERIARMCEEIFGGLNQDAAEHLQKQFSATNNNIVLEKDITFYSVCEHHLLPFYGKAHVAYIPNDIRPILEKADIEQIYVNGRKAEELYKKYIEKNIDRHAICLPSTSPANAAWKLDRLIEAWSVILFGVDSK